MSGAPSLDNEFLAEHVRRLTDSYRQLTGRALVEVGLADTDLGETVFDAPFALLSSGTEVDPLFNYANRTALALFELNWDSLTTMLARDSAEPVHQHARAALMERVRTHGYIDDYTGVRISATGRRFSIENATVWNVVDSNGGNYGQAATFSTWRPL